MPATLPLSRFFRGRVTAITDLSPSFRRFTFGGNDLADFGDPGCDERIKIVFPSATATIDHMPRGDDWFTQWRNLPHDERVPFRTYTTRYVRNDQSEVDVDMVVHAVDGPASAWINSARLGDEVLIWAPTTAHTGVSYGVDFVPPAQTEQFLLVGDETAAPAIAAILEHLPQSACGRVVLEVPLPGDVDYLPRHSGFTYDIHAREAHEHGAHLVSGTTSAVAEMIAPGRGAEVEEVDIDNDILWEVPRTAKGAAALKSAPLYAWLAGEAGAIKAIRRHLVTSAGIDRRAVAFMGYWRIGRAEN